MMQSITESAIQNGTLPKSSPGRVVHMMRWFLPFTGTFIRNQITYHRRYRPHLVFTEQKDSHLSRELAEAYDHFTPFAHTSFDRSVYRTTRILTPSARRQIAHYIQGIGPQVIHVHYGVDALVYSGLLRQLDLPACVSFYGYDCTSFPKRFGGLGTKLLERYVFHNPAIKAVLAMTPDMQRDLLDLGCPEKKVYVHYYGTETNPFFVKRSYSDKDEVSFLMLSGLHPKKGHRFLLNAWQQLTKTIGIPMHLHIVGDGPLRKNLEKMVEEQGIHNLTFHGAVDYGSEQHKQFLRMADVFVHPSVRPADGDKEGIPGAIIEAMAAGLPVVSTFHAGIPYIIQDGKTGLLVREGDTEGLTQAMGRLATDGALRKALGTHGQQHAIGQLDVEQKEQELEAIYDLISP